MPLLYRKWYALRCVFFASGTYLYAVGDAENLGKNTVCRTIHKVVLALQGYMNSFIVFPGHLSTMSIKEGFYKIAGKIGRVTSQTDLLLFPSPKSRFHLEHLNYTIHVNITLNLLIYIYINLMIGFPSHRSNRLHTCCNLHSSWRT